MLELAPFLLALTVVYVLPGPDMLLLMETTAQRGRLEGIGVLGGLAAARSGHVLLAALGMTALLTASPQLLLAVKVVGGTYLIALGVQLWRSTRRNIPAAVQAGTVTPAAILSVWHWTRRGFLTNFLNPKSLVFCSVLLPQFLNPTMPIAPQFVLLGALLVGIGVAFDLLYVTLGATLGRACDASPRLALLRNGIFSALLMALGANVMLS